MFLRQFRQHARTNRTGRMAPKRGMQRRWRRTNSTDRRNLLDGQVRVLARERMSLRVTDQNLCQWPHLHRLVIETRSFHPGILLLSVPTGERGLGFSLPGMKRLGALIVG